MERRLSAASRRSAPSPIQQLSHLAQRVGAVNLAEGFPDFPAPPHVDPLTDFVICCGQSEAFAAAIFASTSTANAHSVRATEL